MNMSSGKIELRFVPRYQPKPVTLDLLRNQRDHRYGNGAWRVANLFRLHADKLIVSTRIFLNKSARHAEWLATATMIWRICILRDPARIVEAETLAIGIGENESWRKMREEYFPKT